MISAAREKVREEAVHLLRKRHIVSKQFKEVESPVAVSSNQAKCNDVVQEHIKRTKFSMGQHVGIDTWWFFSWTINTVAQVYENKHHFINKAMYFSLLCQLSCLVHHFSLLFSITLLNTPLSFLFPYFLPPFFYLSFRPNEKILCSGFLKFLKVGRAVGYIPCTCNMIVHYSCPYTRWLTLDSPLCTHCCPKINLFPALHHVEPVWVYNCSVFFGVGGGDRMTIYRFLVRTHQHAPLHALHTHLALLPWYLCTLYLPPSHLWKNISLKTNPGGSSQPNSRR